MSEFHPPPSAVLRCLTVEFEEGGSFNVREGERCTGHLNLDEMLGMLAQAGFLHRPDLMDRPTLYRMETEQGWRDWGDSLSAKRQLSHPTSQPSDIQTHTHE